LKNYRPTAAWATLRRRAELLVTVRRFFVERGFIEVETPIASHDTVVDRHLDPLETTFLPDAHSTVGGERMFLQTSPEFAMKRLLATADDPDRPEAIYQICHVFRQGEVGPRHNPEFTMVEWYRLGDDYTSAMQLLSDLAEATLARGPAERLTYAEAFARYVQIDAHRATVPELEAAGRAQGLVPAVSFGTDDRDVWLDWLLVELVEPNLGRDTPTILCDYPPSQAALAQVRSSNQFAEAVNVSDPPVAERFELYIDGIELANGYHELLDAETLLERNRANNALRTADGKPSLPESSRLLEAMRAGLPACSGCALGFDRLLMVLLEARTISEVIAFPHERA
jgi:lysyl-tRNA synthetase class 2